MTKPAPMPSGDIKRRGRPAGRTHTAKRSVHLTPGDAERYDAAARDLGVPFAEWAREAFEAFAADRAVARATPRSRARRVRGSARKAAGTRASARAAVRGAALLLRRDMTQPIASLQPRAILYDQSGNGRHAYVFERPSYPGPEGIEGEDSGDYRARRQR